MTSLKFQQAFVYKLIKLTQKYIWTCKENEMDKTNFERTTKVHDLHYRIPRTITKLQCGINEDINIINLR